MWCCISEPWRGGEGATGADIQLQVVTWPARTEGKMPWHRTGWGHKAHHLHMAQERARPRITPHGKGAGRLQWHGHGGPSEVQGCFPCSPGSWLGSWGPVDWGWLRPAWLCLCFSCLARMRFILQEGGGSECQAGQKDLGAPIPIPEGYRDPYPRRI